jgi:hypothetical protein
LSDVAKAGGIARGKKSVHGNPAIFVGADTVVAALDGADVFKTHVAAAVMNIEAVVPNVSDG